MAVIRGTDNDDTLTGTDRNDNIYGYAGNDILHGGGGSDNVFGNAGDDTLYGGDGDDLIVGGHGVGADELYGGGGADIFHYYTQYDSTTAAFDTIHDFETGVDKIRLEPIDANAANNSGGQGRKNISNDEFAHVTSTNGVTPGHLTLTVEGGITVLRGYTDTTAGEDFIIYIHGTVNPLTDIIF